MAIHQGEGSSASITRIMPGAHDAGFGDQKAVIEAVEAHPLPRTPPAAEVFGRNTP